MRFNSKILENLKESPRVHIIRLSRPKDFSFRPGQWVSVWCDDFVDAENKPVHRAFSIASFQDEPHIELCIARGTGLSAHLQDSPAGTAVHVDGPYGAFALKEGKKCLFIAGGVGISPFRPMIKQALDDGRQVILIYSMRIPAEFLYRKEFESLDHENFKVVPTITVDHHYKTWEGEQGRIQSFLKKYYKKDFDVYLCGPPPMVEAVIEKLKRMKHPENRIYLDKWS